MSGLKDPIVVGYKYYIGMHMVTCYGPVDAVTEIIIGDRQAWTGSVTSTQDIYINKPELFGGESREGGVVGTVGIKFGESTQAKDTYLETVKDASGALAFPILSAYRGVVSFILKQVYFGNNPYIKNWAFRVKRLPAKGWYDAKRDIGGHANPAHIIYEAITNQDWGMGLSYLTIDDASFKAAADTLYAENFGLSMIWNQQGTIQDFIQEILNHVAGVFRVDLNNGLFQLKLIRQDYTPASLPLFNESNVEALDSYQRSGWGETVNEMVVQYTDANGENASVTLQDIGNYQIQGSIISETVGYAGIVSGELAHKVALRDLMARSTPLSKIRLTVNRHAWNLHSGDVFKLTWPKLGLTEIVYRVGTISGGSLTDGKITIDAIEDVFSLPTNTYVAQQSTSWTAPNSIPAAIADSKLFEVSYWDMAHKLGDIDAQALITSATYYAAAAKAPSSDSYYFNMYENVSGTYTNVATGYFGPSCTVVSALIQQNSTVISYTNDDSMDLLTVGDYGLIGNEVVGVTAFDLSAKTLTVNRGVLDTVPIAHTAGSRIYFPISIAAHDPKEYYTGEVIQTKLTAVTGRGEYAVGSAVANSITLVGRQSKPYPPGKPQVNSAYFPTVIKDQLSLTWTHRDRTQQTVTLIDQTYGNIGPEINTTYTLRLYDETNTLRKTVNLATNNYIWSTEAADCLIEAVSGTLTATVLLHMEGANAGTSFLDETGKAWTAYGNAQISTASYQFGGSSALFDGAGDYIQCAANADLSFGTGDFTIEFWVNTTFNATSTPFPRILATATSTNSGNTVQIWQSGGLAPDTNQNAISLTADGTSIVVSTVSPVNDGNWHHVAFTRQGTTARSFLDGVLKQTATNSTNFSFWGTEGVKIAARGDLAAGSFFTGRLDELRITKGLARYTANFTVPTVPFSYSPYAGYRLNGTIRFELESVRNGLTSFTKHSIQFDRSGYGLNYGKYYGGT